MAKAKKQFTPEPPEGGNPPPVQSWLQYGSRLIHVRGSESQATFAPRIGVHKNTLGHYERGTRELGADALRSLVYMGWNANWLLTGEGPERLEDLQGPVTTGSQDLSEEHLSIAIELADEALQGTWTPNALYARLVRLLYQGVTQGLPMAEVHEFARKSASGLTGDVDGGKSGVGKPGSGGPGGG